MKSATLASPAWQIPSAPGLALVAVTLVAAAIGSLGAPAAGTVARHLRPVGSTWTMPWYSAVSADDGAVVAVHQMGSILGFAERKVRTMRFVAHTA
jgi:hypothetical protein